MTERFTAYCRHKEAAAAAATIPGYTTAEDDPRDGMVRIGHPWSQALFDGPFYRSAAPAQPDLPNISLVFVQSPSGNTVAPDPTVFGGGATDLHLVYEGLSRVDADAVLAGAGTARAKNLVFSVWHPELVALRLARGRPRHPAQVVLTDGGDLRFEDGLMFQEPALRVLIVTRSAVAEQVRYRTRAQPWVEVVDAGEPLSIAQGMGELRARGLEVVSCVGGRLTATALLQARLVTDLYLTTSAVEAGEPNTPYYEGPPLPLHRIVLKQGRGIETGVRFEHLVVTT